MKEIPLLEGGVALVDDKDYWWLIQYEWGKSKSGYARRTVKVNKPRGQKGYYYRSILMHREIMEPPQGLSVDHKDRNRLNNQRANLRFATRAQQQHNTAKRRDTSSKYKGVARDKEHGGWKAEITLEGAKRVFLGLFKDEDDAASAYNEAAVKHFKSFANPNIIPGDPIWGEEWKRPDD